MLSPAEFVESYATIGAGKAAAPARKLLLLGVLAGLLIGLGGVVTNTASFSVENISLAKLICGLLFPFGLIVVVLTGAELFTGNCLIVISVLQKRASLSGLLRNLSLVYLGNFAGALALAAACAYCGQLGLGKGALAVTTIKLAAAKCALPFGNAVVLGILCNILVCAGVMCSLCSKDVAGRAVGAFVPVCFFVICGFEHCIANMYYIPAGLFALTVPQYASLAASAGLDVSALSWGSFFLRNLLPVTLGNLIGGCGFAACIWGAHRPRQ
ncbi:MAG: formate/nitrite transporter family protein [Oscillospiraceae bacterium]